MGVGRFLNANITKSDGIVKSFDRNVAAAFDGDNFRIDPAVQIADGNPISGAFRTIYTWNIPQIASSSIGSIDAIVTQDVALSGAAIGDLIIASPIGSIDSLVGWSAACYSANNAKLRAWYIGSIVLTPGNVPFKIMALKI